MPSIKACPPPIHPPLRVHFKDRQRCQGNKQADREHAGKSLALNFRGRLASHQASLSLCISSSSPQWPCSGTSLADRCLSPTPHFNAFPPRSSAVWRAFSGISLFSHRSHANERQTWKPQEVWRRQTEPTPTASSPVDNVHKHQDVRSLFRWFHSGSTL